jgi:hypothetical protein
MVRIVVHGSFAGLWSVFCCLQTCARVKVQVSVSAEKKKKFENPGAPGGPASSGLIVKVCSKCFFTTIEQILLLFFFRLSQEERNEKGD